MKDPETTYRSSGYRKDAATNLRQKGDILDMQ